MHVMILTKSGIRTREPKSVRNIWESEKKKRDFIAYVIGPDSRPRRLVDTIKTSLIDDR